MVFNVVVDVVVVAVVGVDDAVTVVLHKLVLQHNILISLFL